MITVNVVHRTFQIQYDNATATCFTIDVEGKQYFVTAKHVIVNLRSQGEVLIRHEDQWKALRVRLIGHAETADVSVFASDIVFPAHPLPATTENLIFGQDLFFLGFPFQLHSIMPGLKRDFPIPFIKKGILSASFLDSPERAFYIDGHNNPGFSGGPVVYTLPGKNSYNVLGIISGYRFHLEDTYQNDQPTSIMTKVNTGIIIAYSIEVALELIKLNPHGAPLK